VIYIRDDDVGWTGEEPAGENWELFRYVHETLNRVPGRFMHRVAILAQSFVHQPAIDYMREEINAGRMEAQIHGWLHIDYSKVDESHLRLHLEETAAWILRTFGTTPTKFYAPWGSDGGSILPVCKELGLEWVGAKGAVKPQAGVHALRKGYPLTHLDGMEILMHWHKGYDRIRVKQLVEIYHHGSFAAARIAEPRLYGDYEDAARVGYAG